MLGADDVREKLAGTSLPRDPGRVVLPIEFERLAIELRRESGRELKAAGVLIPIIERGDGLSVLLTRRAEHLRYHAGQVSFPGGRMEEGDADIQATALRETHEEIGVRPDEVEIAGYLETILTITGYTVTPVVGLVKSTAEFRVDPTEVQHAFEVPLGFLLDEANAHASEREVNGVRLPVVEFHYATERIWGATANIVINLRKRLLGTN